MEVNNNYYNNIGQKPQLIPQNQGYTPSYAVNSYPVSYNYPQSAQAITNNAVSSIYANNFVEFPSIKLPYCNSPVRAFKLSNGQNVFIMPKKGPTTIQTFCKVGSFNEPDNFRGISHFIEHNLFNGSKNLKPNEFVGIVNDMGGKYNASTGFLSTDYYIKTPLHSKKDFKKALDIHADMLKSPSFLDKSLEKEKGPVISEIQMLEDNPYNKSTNLLLKNLFNIETKSADLIGGTVNNIENLTRDDVVNYYNKWYTPDNMTTVIVGDVNPDETIRMINQSFNTQRSPKTNSEQKYFENLSNSIQSTVRKDISVNGLESPLVSLAFAGPQNFNVRENLLTEALNIALCGYENAKLVKSMKKFDTEPTVYKEIVGPKLTDRKAIIVQSTFKKGDEEEGLKQIYATLHGISLKPLEDKDILIIKNKLKDTLSNVSESSMGISNSIGQSIMGNGTIEGYSNALNIIESITADDIQNFAKQYIDLNKTSIVVSHPKNNDAISFGSSNAVNFKSNDFIKNDVNEYNLQNNARMVINDNHYSQRSCANLEIASNQIPHTKAGVVQLTSMLMDEGTKNYTKDQIEEIFDINNIRNGLEVTPYSMMVETDSNSENALLSLKMAKEILYNPDFTEEKLTKAKKELKLVCLDASKSPYNRAVEKLYPNHPFGNTPRKILEEIDDIQLKDITEFYNKIITQGQTKAVITAPVSSTPMLFEGITNELSLSPLANKTFNPLEPIQTSEMSENTVIAQSDNRNQAHIIQMFKINESGNVKDRAALNVLNQILGGSSHSRLFMDLREKQKLAYVVSSDYSSNGRSGEITLEIKTTTEDNKNNHEHFDNLQKSLNGFKNHIEKIKNEPVEQEELESAKLALKSRMIFGSESTLARNNMLSGGYNSFYGSKYNEEFLNAVENLTIQDVQNAAKIYL
ncbi:MAG: pitrilysin family protein [Candidatus Gastranaerophilales bacterium]|nr:pitrilysin family protein [Candidatus Gastranaerophilales bacterium]